MTLPSGKPGLVIATNSKSAGSLPPLPTTVPARTSGSSCTPKCCRGHEGQGLGSKLARFALDDTRRQHLKVVPTCPFIAKFIQGHAEYQDLVVGQNRG